MNDSLVSIIIPVYNKELYLKETLESVINQSYQNIEIILIDDGSKDNSKKICENYSSKYDNIIFLDKDNEGASATRNKGIHLASGKYFLMVDADDIIEPQMVSTMVLEAETHSLDLVCCNFDFVYSNNRVEPFMYSYPKNVVLDRAYIEKNIIPNSIGISKTGSSMGYHTTLMYKTSLILNNEIFYDEKQTKEEDKPFVLKCLSKAQSIMFIDKAFYKYISRSDSLISRYSKRYDNCVKNLNLYESLFGNLYDFYSADKINYNLSIFEECVQFVYLHKNDVDSVKNEIIEMISKPETKKWFEAYVGADSTRNKVKQKFSNNDYEAIYKAYKIKFRVFRWKIKIKKILG